MVPAGARFSLYTHAQPIPDVRDRAPHSYLDHIGPHIHLTWCFLNHTPALTCSAVWLIDNTHICTHTHTNRVLSVLSFILRTKRIWYEVDCKVSYMKEDLRSRPQACRDTGIFKRKSAVYCSFSEHHTHILMSTYPHAHIRPHMISVIFVLNFILMFHPQFHRAKAPGVFIVIWNWHMTNSKDSETDRA